MSKCWTIFCLTEIIWPPNPWAASAHSRTALSWGYPTPVFFLVVQTDPGPIPILMMSAPANKSSSTISPVTTLPAFKSNSTISFFLINKNLKFHEFYHYCVVRKLISNSLDKLHKVFRVSIGNIKTYVGESRYGIDYFFQFCEISLLHTWTYSNILKHKNLKITF